VDVRFPVTDYAVDKVFEESEVQKVSMKGGGRMD